MHTKSGCKKRKLKKCPTCGKSKRLSSFYQDRSRPDGLQWRCKACQLQYYAVPKHKSKNRRKAKKRRDKLAVQKLEQRRQEMRGDRDFKELYNNQELKRFILKTAKTQKHAAEHPEYFDELTQEAWLKVAEAPRGCDIATLKQEARRAIWAAAKRFWREREGKDHVSLESYNDEWGVHVFGEEG